MTGGEHGQETCARIIGDAERRVARELRVQADAYRKDEAGTPRAVARWLRALADDLEAAEDRADAHLADVLRGAPDV